MIIISYIIMIIIIYINIIIINIICAQIQMLHCIKQADGEGGDNTLVDGFKIANDLRQSAPELFDILTKELVEFYDSGTDALGDFYMQSRHKIIS